MKLVIKTTRIVREKVGIETEIPDENLICMNPEQIEKAFMDKACDIFSRLNGLAEHAEYEAEEPNLPFNINWVKRPEDNQMICGGFSPQGTLGSVEM